MERDIIVLYIIAGVSSSFALFNCILFAIKHGKTERNSRIGGNNEKNGMVTLSCLRRQNP